MCDRAEPAMLLTTGDMQLLQYFTDAFGRKTALHIIWVTLVAVGDVHLNLAPARESRAGALRDQP